MSETHRIFGRADHPRRTSTVTLGFLVAACITGAIIPFYIGAIGDGIGKLMALPAGIALLTFLLLDRKKLLVMILIFRSAGDIVFETTRVSVGGYQIGVGGVINAFVILIVLFLVAESPRTLPRKFLLAWSAILVAAMLGVAISPTKGEAIRTYLSMCSCFAVFVGAFYLVRSPSDLKFCIRVILWSSVIPVLYGYMELVTGSGHGGGARVQGTFAHPNIFAFYLVLVVSLTLYMLKSQGNVVTGAARAGLNFYILMLLGLLLMTQTRSAWVACFAIFAIYGLLFERRFLAYILVIPFLALLVPGVQDRLVDLSAGNEYVQYAKLNSFAWRRLIWESGLQWMRPDHYLTGYGLESFRYFSLAFFPLVNQTGTGSGAHNVYVQLLFELGVFGLVGYLWLFGRLLRLLKPMASFDKLAALTVAANIIAYMIVSLSDNMLSYLSFNWYFWFLVGSACAVVQSRTHATSLQMNGSIDQGTPGMGGLSPAMERGLIK